MCHQNKVNNHLCPICFNGKQVKRMTTDGNLYWCQACDLFRTGPEVKLLWAEVVAEIYSKFELKRIIDGVQYYCQVKAIKPDGRLEIKWTPKSREASNA